MNETNRYLEEMIELLDFDSLNDFLNNHLRIKMNFEELIAQISMQGMDAINKENIMQMLFDAFFYELSIVRPIFIKMLLFTVLFSVIQRLLISKKTYVSKIAFFLIYATLMVLLMQSFSLVKEIALEGMEGILSFLRTLIPTYTVTMVFTGNAVSGAMAYELAFFLIYLLEFLLKNFISPWIHIFVLVLFLNHMMEEDRLSKLAEFIEKTICFLLKASFGVVIGLGVVQSLLSPMKDRIASHVILSGVSSIPGVGGALGSAGELIFSCGMLIKNSVGIIGLLILLLVSAVPMLKIGVIWVMYYLLAILLQPVSDKNIISCVSGVARGCNLYMKTFFYAVFMFFVLIAIVTMATSFVF